MFERRKTLRFLTSEIAEKAVCQVVDPLMEGEGVGSLFKRHHLYVVVLVPSLVDGFLQPYVIYDKSYGKEDWEHDYDGIANSKAFQRWHNQNDNRTGCKPHLLFKGDTPYWGAIEYEGIIVACSGVQAYFDQMMSGMIAHAIVALVAHAFENRSGSEKKQDFV